MSGANASYQQQEIPKVSIMGVPFSALSFQDTISLIQSWMGQTTVPHQVVTANPEIVMAARSDEEIWKVLQQADLVTPDGIGIVYGARILGHTLEGRVTGADMLPHLLDKANREKWPVFLLGASPQSNKLAQTNLTVLYPNLPIAGRDGFFKEEEIPDILSQIRRHSPRLLLVGLSLGKQEKFIAQHLHEMGVPVCIGVGGCIDLYAGIVKRAPELWRKLHVEWLYRLLKQPSRWRRQLVLPKFAFEVLKQRLTGKN